MMRYFLLGFDAFFFFTFLFRASSIMLEVLF